MTPQGSRRALLVLDGLYSAGAQRHCLELLDVFGMCGIAVTVLALEGGGQWADSFLSRSQQVVVARDRMTSWDALTQVAEDFGVCDFVSAHLVAGAQWAEQNVPISIPVFAHLHSEISEHEVIEPVTLHKIARRAVSVLFPCGETMEHYRRLLAAADGDGRARAEFRVLPNGFATDEHRPRNATSATRRVGRPPHLAVVSRLDTDKFSIPLFVDTVKHLVAQFPSIEVHVAGVGECFDEVNARVQEGAIAKSVKFLGFVRDVWALYEWADAVFLPSKREGMPYVLLEAVLAGRPVVAPKVGVFRDAACRDLMRTFCPGSAESAARAIAELLKSDAPRRRRCAEISPMLFADNWHRTVCEAYRLC